jgi:hypothetical protein
VIFRGPRPDSRAQAISPHAAGTTGVATEGEGAKTAVGMQARAGVAGAWWLRVKGVHGQIAENEPELPPH